MSPYLKVAKNALFLARAKVAMTVSVLDVFNMLRTVFRVYKENYFPSVEYIWWMT